jgi:hypothetical protein
MNNRNTNSCYSTEPRTGLLRSGATCTAIGPDSSVAAGSLLSRRSRALRYGLQALRGLGLRLTELAQMSPLSLATLKRHTRTIDPTFVQMRASLEKLTIVSKEALTLIWVRSIAGGRPIPPPVPQRAFLDFFCPHCLDRSSPEWEPLATSRARHCPPYVIDGSSDADLTHALTSGLEVCEVGARVCASAPARFAAVLLALRVHPWEAHAFVTAEIAPNRWWVRPCLGCGRDVITESPATRLCPQCRTRSR